MDSILSFIENYLNSHVALLLFLCLGLILPMIL